MIDNYIVQLISKYPTNILQHCIRVANIAGEYEDIDWTIGLLHDIIEDTNVTILEIPEEYRPYIILLTRNKSEKYFDYINRIKMSNNTKAIYIKLCDIKDHLDNKDTLSESLYKRYTKAKRILEGE